jgi:hypothetical protein
VNIDLAELLQDGFVAELAKVFDMKFRRGRGDELLDKIRFPRGNVPIDARTSTEFWKIICEEIARGILPSGAGLEVVVSAAVELYESNPVFRRCAEKLRNETNGDCSEPLVCIFGLDDTHRCQILTRRSHCGRTGNRLFTKRIQTCELL